MLNKEVTRGAGILLQVSEEGGDKESPARYPEEQETGNSWRMPELRD